MGEVPRSGLLVAGGRQTRIVRQLALRRSISGQVHTSFRQLWLQSPSGIQGSEATIVAEMGKNSAMSEASQIPTFEVGLVLAGAISAGAYTAGVMDFLIEALDTWEDAKASGDPSVPMHRVMIQALGGASAGAMTAAVAAVALNSEVDPVRDIGTPPAAERNRLFDAWVRQIAAEKLLGDADLRQQRREGKGVASLLDSSALDAIAKVVLHAPLRRTPRAYVSDPLPVLLTVANLQGVPYGFQFAGPHGTVYEMLNHADHMRFSVTRNGMHRAEEVVLDPVDMAGKNWRLLTDAALASGAFPIGLSSRLLSRPFPNYDDRIKGVRPQWFRDREEVPNDPYVFRCVDGGLLDNEPLELVRRCLTRDESGQKQNERSGKAANRAVILVDPFPNRVDFNPGSYADKDGFFRTIGSVFYTLLEQSRFKPEELKLAADPTVFSRFMIFPTQMTIASGILSGFGGFLAEEYRRHDFQLGRRNCQWFYDGISSYRRATSFLRIGNRKPTPAFPAAMPIM
jgi:predicted acylesterase/phospholipase RssA